LNSFTSASRAATSDMIVDEERYVTREIEKKLKGERKRGSALALIGVDMRRVVNGGSIAG